MLVRQRVNGIISPYLHRRPIQIILVLLKRHQAENQLADDSCRWSDILWWRQRVRNLKNNEKVTCHFAYTLLLSNFHMFTSTENCTI